MSKKIRVITFDLDDTLWDNVPTITKAETETRKWIGETLMTFLTSEKSS